MFFYVVYKTITDIVSNKIINFTMAMTRKLYKYLKLQVKLNIFLSDNVSKGRSFVYSKIKLQLFRHGCNCITRRHYKSNYFARHILIHKNFAKKMTKKHYRKHCGASIVGMAAIIKQNFCKLFTKE